MKKAFVLIWLIFLIILLGTGISLSLNNTSYIPKLIKHSYDYLQAQILIHNAKEFSKYFLYQAKKENKQCLNAIHFNYAQALIKIKYFYPLAQCKDFQFSTFNKDANLSRDGLILVHISIALSNDKNVNDATILTKNLLLYPKENFWNQ